MDENRESGARLIEYKKWFAAQPEFAGQDPMKSIAGQVRFSDYEMKQGSERKAGEKFFGSLTAAEANRNFTQYYERPGAMKDPQAREREFQDRYEKGGSIWKRLTEPDTISQQLQQSYNAVSQFANSCGDLTAKITNPLLPGGYKLPEGGLTQGNVKDLAKAYGAPLIGGKENPLSMGNLTPGTVLVGDPSKVDHAQSIMPNPKTGNMGIASFGYDGKPYTKDLTQKEIDTMNAQGYIGANALRPGGGATGLARVQPLNERPDLMAENKKIAQIKEQAAITKESGMSDVMSNLIKSIVSQPQQSPVPAVAPPDDRVAEMRVIPGDVAAYLFTGILDMVGVG